MPDIVPYALAVGDDALVLGHRLSEWSSRAPTIEEDIALSNLGLDLIGQARLFYQLAGELEGRGRDEDALAYFRDAGEYRCIHLVQFPKGDFAFTMARQLVYSAFVHPYYEVLQGSRESRLAEIAAKAVKEMAYHLRHSAEWVIRLGDGTDESRQRMVAALEAIWPYTGELFRMTDDERALAAGSIVPDRESLRLVWQTTIGRVLAEAKLDLPAVELVPCAGRDGFHTPHLSEMLAEMQSLARAMPDAKW